MKYDAKPEKANSPPPKSRGGAESHWVKLMRGLLGFLKPQSNLKLRKPSWNHSSWAAILSGEKATKCPADDFLHVIAELKNAGDLAKAEATCNVASTAHPLDLRIAIEHAALAQILKNNEFAKVRWQKAIEIGGDLTPPLVFNSLAECHLKSGNLTEAEVQVRNGLKVRPRSFSLMEKLAIVLTTIGRPEPAIAAWKNLIDTHPNKEHITAYFQMGAILRDEGLLDKATNVLMEGTLKYPASSKLQDAVVRISLAIRKYNKTPKSPEQAAAFLSHLWQDFRSPFSRGILGVSTDFTAARKNVPAMLDFEAIVFPEKEPARISSVDVFAHWGVPSLPLPQISEMASTEGKPLLYLDSGWISSVGLESDDCPILSVIITPESSHQDSTQPSQIENTLNSDQYTLTALQQVRAEAAINSIVSHRITKFNHAPSIDLRLRFPANGAKRILLVDQKVGGGALHWGLGGVGAFERMWEAAISQADHEVFIKLHPETISGKYGSYLKSLLPTPLPQNVTLIDFHVNPFNLFDVVDQVFVCTSQLGFEAVMAGKEVHCFAAPAYAGWGFTNDRIAIPRRRKMRTVAEVFHLFYIVHARYFIPNNTNQELENLIDYLITSEKPTTVGIAITSSPASTPAATREPLKILIVIPSGRHGASGRYLQTLAVSLIQLGCRIMILAEGPWQRVECGVRWLTLEFDGLRLKESIRREILEFAPDFIYENGVRSRSQRAALEAVALTGARFAMQSEDDDIQVHENQHGADAAASLSSLDRAQLSSTEISEFLRNHDWNHSLHIFLDPNFDRWIEPLLRIVCYRMACLHTAIWHPFAERLANEYKVPTLVVPPVASRGDFERILLTWDEREIVLRRYKIDPERTVIFIGGALYNFSNEYSIFLDALNLAAKKSGGKFALVVASGRSSLPLERMARERLTPETSFTDLGVASDELYAEMLKACDIVCSPGLPDTFNRYRLPSRLVKAMAMGKPILTCRCGFGESLEHHGNAFLMDGSNPAAWADTIGSCLEPALREKVGTQGQLFAREHFDSDRVAASLKKQLEAILQGPPRTFASGIDLAPNKPNTALGIGVRSHSSIKVRELSHSPLQTAIRALAMRTHELDTVVHIGPGPCHELDDYCRLGANEIRLIVPPNESNELRSAENTRQTFSVRGAQITDGDKFSLSSNIPSLPHGRNHLLTIQANSSEWNFDVRPELLLLDQFHWILIHTPENSDESDRPLENLISVLLNSAGFHAISLFLNPSGDCHVSLFARNEAIKSSRATEPLDCHENAAGEPY